MQEKFSFDSGNSVSIAKNRRSYTSKGCRFVIFLVSRTQDSPVKVFVLSTSRPTCLSILQASVMRLQYFLSQIHTNHPRTMHKLDRVSNPQTLKDLFLPFGYPYS